MSYNVDLKNAWEVASGSHLTGKSSFGCTLFSTSSLRETFPQARTTQFAKFDAWCIQQSSQSLELGWVKKNIYGWFKNDCDSLALAELLQTAHHENNTGGRQVGPAAGHSIPTTMVKEQQILPAKVRHFFSMWLWPRTSTFLELLFLHQSAVNYREQHLLSEYLSTPTVRKAGWFLRRHWESGANKTLCCKHQWMYCIGT